MPNLALRLQAPRLDRIVRGRAWIPLLGVSLLAIVGLRVEVLRLGSAVGSQVQQAAVLASGNSQLRAQISALSDNQRIESLAAAYGMRMPTPLDLHFLRGSSGRDAAAAIRNITPPSRSTFLSGLAAERQNNLAKAAANSTLSAIGGPANSLSTTSTSTLGSTSLSATPTGVSTGSATGVVQGAGGSSALTSTGTVGGAGTVSSDTAASGVTSSSTTATSVSGAPAAGTAATGTSTGAAGSGSGAASQSTLTGTSDPAGASPTTGSSNGGTSLSG